jgi:hypothetical protein
VHVAEAAAACWGIHSPGLMFQPALIACRHGHGVAYAPPRTRRRGHGRSVTACARVRVVWPPRADARCGAATHVVRRAAQRARVDVT